MTTRRSVVTGNNNRRHLARHGLSRDRLTGPAAGPLVRADYVPLSVLAAVELAGSLVRMARVAASDPEEETHWRRVLVIANALIDSLAVDLRNDSTTAVESLYFRVIRNDKENQL